MLPFGSEGKVYGYNEKNIQIECESTSEAVLQHLQSIFYDLTQQNILTSQKILLLDCYPILEGLKFQSNSFSFESVGKPDLNVASGNTIVFWRMDYSNEYAHYEFFLSTSEGNSLKMEYMFELRNNQWVRKL